MTITTLLQDAVNKLESIGIEDASLDAWLLLSKAVGITKAQYLANPDLEIPGEVTINFNEMLERRLNREPVQLILGETEFMGLKFFLDGKELIPRQDTEILVEEVLKFAKGKALSLLDIFTGSGCIPISLSHYGSFSNISAGDISPDAINNAEKNAKENNAQVTFKCGDMFEPFAGEAFDIITANPPYIKTEDTKTLMPEVKDFDPMLALDGGETGLDFYKRIASEAKNHLTETGTIFMEIGFDQAEDIKEIFEKENYKNIKVVKDLAGLDRVVICQN